MGSVIRKSFPHRTVWAFLLALLLVLPGCTADFELLGGPVDVEIKEDLDVLDLPDEVEEADDGLAELEVELEAEIELTDTRDQLPPAISCPEAGTYPDGMCFLNLVDDPFVPSDTDPVFTWKLAELAANEYNGMWVDADVYLENWVSSSDLARHDFFRAQVAPKGALVLPGTKLIGCIYTAPLNYLALEQGMTANKVSIKLQEDVQIGYWYHVSYKYFPADGRKVDLEVTRDGVSVLEDEAQYHSPADVSLLRVVNGEEVVVTLGFPKGDPHGVVTAGWEYRNVRVVAFACGDGFVDQSEDCDTGDELDSSACDSDCSAVVCGDNHKNSAVESCDDGNIVDGDACPADCTIP